PEIIPDVWKRVSFEIDLEGEQHLVDWVIIEETTRPTEQYRDYIQADLEDLLGSKVRIVSRTLSVQGKKYLPATRWLIANGFCSDVANAEYHRKKILEDMS